MSYIDYSSMLDKKIDLTIRHYDIACESAYHEYMVESIGSLPELFTEAEEVQQSGGFSGFLKRIVTYVTNLINDILEMFHNMFHPKDNEQLEAMLKNDNGTFNPGCDLDKVSDAAANKIRKGNRLISMIASGANISEEEVNEYIKSGLTTVAIAAPPAIATALGLKMYNKWSKKQKENGKQVADAAAKAENVQDPKKQTLISKIMNTMSSAISESIKVGRTFQKNYDGYIKQKFGKNKNKEAQNV